MAPARSRRQAGKRNSPYSMPRDPGSLPVQPQPPLERGLPRRRRAARRDHPPRLPRQPPHRLPRPAAAAHHRNRSTCRKSARSPAGCCTIPTTWTPARSRYSPACASAAHSWTAWPTSNQPRQDDDPPRPENATSLASSIPLTPTTSPDCTPRRVPPGPGRLQRRAHPALQFRLPEGNVNRPIKRSRDRCTAAPASTSYLHARNPSLRLANHGTGTRAHAHGRRHSPAAPRAPRHTSPLATAPTCAVDASRLSSQVKEIQNEDRPGQGRTGDLPDGDPSRHKHGLRRAECLSLLKQ
jgi:hypothetical protein